MKRFVILFFIAAAFILGLVISSSGWQEEKQKSPAHTRWEIRKVEKWADAAKLAEEGWELVGGTDYQYFLKRSKQ